jgi:hypothetical protein
MRDLVFAMALGICSFASPAFAADAEPLSGQLVKLAEVNDGPFSVNVGGLVIAVVRDSGSRPPQNIEVKASSSLELLGKVRGAQNDRGQALMGGGYNWYLFRPTEAGEATVSASYLENGDDGKKVNRDYRLTIE